MSEIEPERNDQYVVIRNDGVQVGSFDVEKLIQLFHADVFKSSDSVITPQGEKLNAEEFRKQLPGGYPTALNPISVSHCYISPLRLTLAPGMLLFSVFFGGPMIGSSLLFSERALDRINKQIPPPPLPSASKVEVLNYRDAKESANLEISTAYVSAIIGMAFFLAAVGLSIHNLISWSSPLNRRISYAVLVLCLGLVAICFLTRNSSISASRGLFGF